MSEYYRRERNSIWDKGGRIFCKGMFEDGDEPGLIGEHGVQVRALELIRKRTFLEEVNGG